MNLSSYQKGSYFLQLMKLAFPNKNLSAPGMSGAILANLIDKENGEFWVKHLPSAPKQLVQIKKYMHAALQKLLENKKISRETARELAMLKEQINGAYNGDDIYELVYVAIDLIRGFK